MHLSDFLLGRPLATSEERAEHIGSSAGIPIFGLDALSSAAYGPEAALTLLIPLGLEGVHIILPISAAIIALLVIVYFSYRQTIEAYPRGGGSYTVASENLGRRAGPASGVRADDRLCADGGGRHFGGRRRAYLRRSIAAGAQARLVPGYSGGADSDQRSRSTRHRSRLILPTYLFVGSLLIIIVVGIAKVLFTGGHPAAVVAPPHLPAATAAVSLWLILKVFASGCTAMTGVEAVSNGVLAFREPTTKNAQKTLTIIIALLILLLAGIAFLCHAYGVGATDPEGSGYQSVLSQLIGAVMGRGVFYYVSIGSILLVLALSANTAFADFPRLTRAIALNDYLPHVFLIRGRRLLYSHGIGALVFLTGSLLLLFGGVTDRLIPLYAIGAFLAFTLSQAGMVAHWWKHRSSGWQTRMLVNGTGAFATGVTLLVVLVAKFAAGAWVTALLIPILIAIMAKVKRHYIGVDKETLKEGPIEIGHIAEPIVVIPIDRWSKITEKGLRFALMLSREVRAVHVDCEEDEESVCNMWEANVAAPLRAANMIAPELVLLHSPYRFVIQPVVDYVLDVERQNEDRHVAVLVPELVVRRWYQNLLHNQRANLLKLLLLMRGNQRVLVINIPWYMEAHTDVKVLDKNAKEKREATASS